MSHLLLQLYPITVSNNSHMQMMHSFLSFFPLDLYLAVSAASSGVSLLFTAGSSKSLVLNPTKTEAICFGTRPRLQLLSNLTYIEVAGTPVSLADYVKVLGVIFDKHLNFDKHISNVCSSSYSISVLSTIFVLFSWLRNFHDHCLCYCWFYIRLCKFH